MKRMLEEPKPAKAADTRLTLAFLWVWLLFNYVYGDIFHIFTIIMEPAMLERLQQGYVGEIPLNRQTMLAMAAAMQLSIMMVFLAWKLEYRLNRLLNLAIGTLFTLIIAATLLGSGRLPPLSGYTFYSVIEIATTAAIVRVAWRWREPAST